VDPTSTGGALHHPTVLAQQAQRAAHRQVRIADAITAYAGSMPFVYVHIVAFAAWMLFFESSPWPALTLVVSLEAIFLSRFVMIGPNRQAAFQQARADHDLTEQELELKTNTQLTRAIHKPVVVAEAARPVGQRPDEVDPVVVGHQLLPEPDAVSARNGETVDDGVAERHHPDPAIRLGAGGNRRDRDGGKHRGANVIGLLLSDHCLARTSPENG
jgi:uncharacterized membrane protein